MPLRLSPGDSSSEPASPAKPSGSATLDSLPDELLIQIFGHLAVVGNIWEDDDQLHLGPLPYRQPDHEPQPPSTGLRGYPFLAQVCRKWKRLLATPTAQQLVWRHVCIDFGHELVTAIHTPLRWSNQRPSTADYQLAFANTVLSANKVLGFLGSISPHIRSLAVANSEGFQGDEGEYVSLADKHNFGAGHLGFALALMREGLTELNLHRCDDLVSAPSGVWTLLAQLPALRVLAIEGLRGLVQPAQAAGLGELRKLESLTITGETEEYRNDWAVGLDAIPSTWSRLTALTRLELRSHQLLLELPAWLAELRALRSLDLSGCTAVALGLLPRMTQLEVLVLQSMCLGHSLPTSSEAAALTEAGYLPARRALPDLLPLAASLRSLSLSRNRFTQLPAWLPRLTRLEHLDVANNPALHIQSSLGALAALPAIRLLDFRKVHVGQDDERFWCEAKCVTMGHLSQLAKALKRRYPPPRLLFDI